MRQVPRYLIIGNGRVAKHFQHYFSYLQLPFATWCRKDTIATLNAHAKQSTHILLLINDDAIIDFAYQHLLQTSAVLVHFSGSLNSELIIGAHPLFSFSHQLHDLDTYKKIPFIIDSAGKSFVEILPLLPNKHYRIIKEDKAKYHALCVLGGNFSSLLWQKVFSEFYNNLNLPHEVLHPYIKQLTENLMQHPDAALTGPLVRGDINTIEKNINALANDPYQEIYRSFVTCFKKIKSEAST